MRYFAYGSNMLTARLRSRVPSARPVGTAQLSGHSLRWHKKSVDASGKCDAFCTGDETDVVHGVLFEMSAAEKPQLDAAEGVGSGYESRSIPVVRGENTEEAVPYLAQSSSVSPRLRPYSWERDLVVGGAREHCLPDTYSKHLAEQPADDDADSDRAAEQRGFLEAGDA